MCVYPCTHARERDTQRDREGGKGRDSCCFLKIVKIVIAVEVIYMLESIHLKKISLYAVDLIVGFDQSLTPFQGHLIMLVTFYLSTSLMHASYTKLY